MFYTFKIKKYKLIIGIFLLIFIFFVAFATIKIINYYPIKHIDAINKYSEEYGLDPAFVSAVIHTESKFDEDAISGKGASGLMQLTEPTALWLSKKLSMDSFDYSQIFDPEINIRLGCFYLSLLLEKYDNDYNLAICSYNAGSSNVNKWLENPEYSKDRKTLDYIPFKETRNFVKRIEICTKIYDFLLSH